jgi:hypothetical protein
LLLLMLLLRQNYHKPTKILADGLHTHTYNRVEIFSLQRVSVMQNRLFRYSLPMRTLRSIVYGT